MATRRGALRGAGGALAGLALGAAAGGGGARRAAGGARLLAPPPALAEITKADSRYSEVEVPVEKLPNAVVVEELNELRALAEKYVGECVTASPAAVLRLYYLDAISFDKKTKQGGLNGSIRFDAELDKVGAADLKPVVKQISALQSKISGGYDGPAIGWADTLVLAAFNKITQYLRDTIQEGVDDPELKEGRLKFAAVVPNPKIGREDATGPNPDAVPPLADAPDADVLAAFDRAGIRKGYIAPFAFALGDRDAVEKKWADSSDDQLAYYAKKVIVNRSASLQTNYQIDLANAFVALSYLGLKDPTGPNYQRYLYPYLRKVVKDPLTAGLSKS